MSQGPDDADLIMHAQLEASNGMTLMASDTPPSMTVPAAGRRQHLAERG